MHLRAYSRSRVACETADNRLARLQRLHSCVRKLQESGASSGSPHNSLHSLVSDMIWYAAHEQTATQPVMQPVHSSATCIWGVVKLGKLMWSRYLCTHVHFTVINWKCTNAFWCVSSNTYIFASASWTNSSSEACYDGAPNVHFPLTVLIFR